MESPISNRAIEYKIIPVADPEGGATGVRPF